MNKTKKALASLAIAGMVLSMAPVSVFAAETETRLAGADRYLTSIKIAEKAYASADTAVVAAGNPNNLVDALAAAPLAAQEDAPIYLTDKADMNDDVVKSMKALGVDKVIVVGAAASKAVVDELKAAGFSVEEVKGAGRVETAEAINKKLTAPAGTFVVGYDGVADAMSVASYAAANNYAIVVANQNGTPNGTVDADYIVGGTTRVKDIAGAKRLAGDDRYDTNKQVIAELDFDFGTVYVGNGLTLADALVGSVLAAQTNSPIALTDGKTVKADIASNLADDSVVVALGGTAAVSNAVIDAVKNPPSTGVFALESVTATSADTFTVKFAGPAADTSKVTFEVKQDTAPVAVSASWNEAKTEATLQKSAKFVEAVYTVSVKDGEKDLGSKNVSVTEQKVAKIDITSEKLGVVTRTVGDEQKQYGYATYKIFDQYQVDITNSALANNVEFQTGVGDITPDKGLLTIEPNDNLNLLTFSGGIVISAHETTSGVSTTKNLMATSQIGTLSDFTFKPVKLELTAGDTATVTYLDFTATDISGNETKNYTLLEEGLIFVSNTKGDQNFGKLTTSHPQVTAELVSDPADSKKGLIKVTVDSSEVQVDMPGVITAMTWTGKTSQVDFTLKKQAEVSKFKLYAPSEVIASNESKEIPFAAYDQNGKAITKFADLDGKVEISKDTATLVRNADGTASVKSVPYQLSSGQSSVTRVVTSVVGRTGDFSSVNIRIQKPVQADALKVDTDVVKSILQAAAADSNGTLIDTGATQVADFGWDAGGFTIVDQYGRDIDMTTLGKNNDYKILVNATGKIKATVLEKNSAGKLVPRTGTTNMGTETTPINVNNDKLLINGESQVEFEALGVGSGAVTFTLYDGTKPVDSKSMSFTSIKSDDIKDYRIDQLEKPIYAYASSTTTASALTLKQKDYKVNPKVYGLTASKADVVLKGNPVIGAVSTSADFLVIAGDDPNGNAYDSIEVVAKKASDPAKAESKGNLTVTIKGADNNLYAVGTPLTSSVANPAAASVAVVVKTQKAGITIDDVDKDKIYLKGTSDQIKALLGTTFNKYTADGTAKGAQNIYFAPKDQYGKTGWGMARYSVLNNSTSIGVSTTGDITLPAGALTDGSITVSASTATGLIKTIEIEIDVN
ncbi:putative cell wall binding repeat 2-containing protein [Desulfitobacterium hafniense DCB-2]|uniref:Putative cell wall binding repeat 2-containing protein n=1 Tax=Desulfitobacterium hafniense (strain DSM 10664 / DCB-2) TaxID=272564 RepID=B8FWI6_DESHD|nr:cell wall-binding repeat-containing protein [Desulfitobacterium hafniense]ACL22484.1 putative cell wall binding repeat 2-containing protein [Desulfitobacterium hafniense DCB-2]